MIDIIVKFSNNVPQTLRRSGRFEPVLASSLRGRKIDRRTILWMHWKRSIQSTQVGKCVLNIA
jgi:hypothetical protein